MDIQATDECARVYNNIKVLYAINPLQENKVKENTLVEQFSLKRHLIGHKYLLTCPKLGNVL